MLIVVNGGIFVVNKIKEWLDSLSEVFWRNDLLEIDPFLWLSRTACNTDQSTVAYRCAQFFYSQGVPKNSWDHLDDRGFLHFIPQLLPNYQS